MAKRILISFKDPKEEKGPRQELEKQKSSKKPFNKKFGPRLSKNESKENGKEPLDQEEGESLSWLFMQRKAKQVQFFVGT